MADKETPKVSLVLRILAWVIVIFVCLGSAAVIHKLIEGESLRQMGWGEALATLLGTLLLVPLATSVAFTGRPPKWSQKLDEITDYNKCTESKKDTRDN